MNDQIRDDASNAVWFVGASLGGNDDQSGRFIANGICEVSRPKDRPARACRRVMGKRDWQRECAPPT